jgi:hypothetical protein
MRGKLAMYAIVANNIEPFFLTKNETTKKKEKRKKRHATLLHELFRPCRTK